jgi:hypothetical protein
MALPGRAQTFAFENCREVLEKLRREIDRYRHAASNGRVDEMKDAAFNASVTAWHLADWVYNDMTAEQRAETKVRSVGGMGNYAREHCRALYLCRHAATASKHWIVTKHPDASVGVVVTANPIQPPGEPTVELHMTEDEAWYTYFVDGEKPIDAGQVFDEALHFWTGFIYQRGIADGREAEP